MSEKSFSTVNAPKIDEKIEISHNQESQRKIQNFDFGLPTFE